MVSLGSLESLILQNLFNISFGCSLWFVPLHLHKWWSDVYQLYVDKILNSAVLFWYTQPSLLCWLLMLWFPLPWTLTQHLPCFILTPLVILSLGILKFRFILWYDVYQFTWIYLLVGLMNINSLRYISRFVLPWVPYIVFFRVIFLLLCS